MMIDEEGKGLWASFVFTEVRVERERKRDFESEKP